MRILRVPGVPLLGVEPRYYYMEDEDWVVYVAAVRPLLLVLKWAGYVLAFVAADWVYQRLTVWLLQP